MPDIDLSGCGRSILVSMIHDLRKRVKELEDPGATGVHDLRKRVVELESALSEKEACPAPAFCGASGGARPAGSGVPDEVRDGVVHLFLSIGSWTNSRWDQHLRYEYGDEKTDKIVQWLIAEGILYEVPKDAWAGFEPEGSLPPLPAAGQAAGPKEKQ